MLVLSRFLGEQLMIETPKGLITVTICRIQGKKVRIGITAPDGFEIKRGELGGR